MKIETHGQRRNRQLKDLAWLRTNRPRTFDQIMIGLAHIVSAVKRGARRDPRRSS